jgi:hypothetical protein
LVVEPGVPVCREPRYKQSVDPLTLFGLVAVTAMLAFYALEERSPNFLVAFALACWAAALYGWLAGTWPFALVEAIWGAVAVRRYTRRRTVA